MAMKSKLLTPGNYNEANDQSESFTFTNILEKIIYLAFY